MITCLQMFMPSSEGACRTKELPPWNLRRRRESGPVVGRRGCVCVVGGVEAVTPRVNVSDCS